MTLREKINRECKLIIFSARHRCHRCQENQLLMCTLDRALTSWISIYTTLFVSIVFTNSNKIVSISCHQRRVYVPIMNTQIRFFHMWWQLYNLRIVSADNNFRIVVTRVDELFKSYSGVLHVVLTNQLFLRSRISFVSDFQICDWFVPIANNNALNNKIW